MFHVNIKINETFAFFVLYIKLSTVLSELKSGGKIKNLDRGEVVIFI